MPPTSIIALDLDGTLLDSQKNLSPANAGVLARAAAAGAEIVPTTGRFFGGIPQAVRDLPFVRYAITINGAQVYDRRTDSALVRVEIPLGTALAIMRLLDGYDVIYALWNAAKAAGINENTSTAEACETLIATFAGGSFTVDGVTGEGMKWSKEGTVTKAPKAVVIENGVYVGF